MPSRRPHLPGQLHVVVTCSNRKRTRTPQRLRLSDLREQRPAQRFAAWTRRLTTDASELRPALDMYAGEHWQVARRLSSVVATRSATLWICSAGYGLIPAQALIRPYAATFSAGEADSVAASRTGVQDWWQRLGAWPGPDPHQPRSFTELAHRDPAASILAVLSEAYQRACANDLLTAAGQLHANSQLSVLGPPQAAPELADLLVPVTATVRLAVGGSLQALNVRVAEHLLGTADANNRDALRSHADTLAQSASRLGIGSVDRSAGERLDDHEVRTYIQSRLADGPHSATRLLRELRASGRSCEQRRFATLYAAVVDREGGKP